MSACARVSYGGLLLHLKNHPMTLLIEGFVLARLLLCLGCGLVWTNFHKVLQLVASIASFLSLLISLIGENEILNLDGHTLDIEPLDHLLHLVDKFH